jgi:hypothetical protein
MTKVIDEDCGEGSGKANVREFGVTSRYSYGSEELKLWNGLIWIRILDPDLNPLPSGY